MIKNKVRFWLTYLFFIAAMMMPVVFRKYYPTWVVNIFGRSVPGPFIQLLFLAVAFALFCSDPEARERARRNFQNPMVRWLLLGVAAIGLLGILSAVRITHYYSDAMKNQRAAKLAADLRTVYATPLMQAVLRDDEKELLELLNHGASVNEKNKFGFTALDYASGAIPPYFDKTAEHPAAVSLLLANGADANAFGENGLTPLMAVAATGNIEIAAALLDHGADINQVSRYGWNALSEAVLRQQERAVEFLLQHGANPNPEIESGHHNLLKIAKDKDNKRIVELLEKAGAKEN